MAVLTAVRNARNGRLLGLPAENGYVLAADAFTAGGVTRLMSAKGLGPRTSLGILVSSPDGVHGISHRIAPAASDLIAAFWPGQLALVVMTQRTLSWSVPTDRCVVRMPLHPLLLTVLADVGPMVASAASPEQLTMADLVLDCGARPNGPGSTVIDITVDPPMLVREGAIPAHRVREVAPDLAAPR